MLGLGDWSAALHPPLAFHVLSQPATGWCSPEKAPGSSVWGLACALWLDPLHCPLGPECRKPAQKAAPTDLLPLWIASYTHCRACYAVIHSNPRDRGECFPQPHPLFLGATECSICYSLAYLDIGLLLFVAWNVLFFHKGSYFWYCECVCWYREISQNSGSF